MKERQVTIKIWKKTLTNYRVLAALKEKSMVSIFDDLITKELKKERKKRNGVLY